MTHRPRPARTPADPVQRAAILGGLSGLLGITVAVTIVLEKPLAWSPPFLAVLAIVSGWVAMLVFAPWRSILRAGRSRRAIMTLTRELRRISTGQRERRLRDLILDRDDELGQLSRVLHDVLAQATADRRESRLLQRTMTDTIRRETDRATQRLQRQAQTDPLTGVGNRRSMEDKLESFFGPARRRHEDTLVAMVLDVDRFKIVNDTLGHDVGDRCLTFLGKLLASTLRGHDTAIRLGGDEFVVLLPNQTMSEARAVAERLAALFGQMPWPHTRAPRPTLSIGLGAAHAGEAGGDEELFRRADEALYRAKHAGRNQIRAFDEIKDEVKSAA